MNNINNRALRFRQVKGYARHPWHTRSTFAPVGNAAANVRVYLYGDERDKCCPYGCGFIVCGCASRAAKPGVSIRERLLTGEWIVDGEPAKPASKAPLREGWVGVDFGYQFRSGECCMRVYRSHSTGLFAVYSVEPEGLLNTTYYERLEDAMLLGERVAHEIEARAKPVEFANGDVVRLLSNDFGIEESVGTLLVYAECDEEGDHLLYQSCQREDVWAACADQFELVRRAGEFAVGDRVRCVVGRRGGELPIAAGSEHIVIGLARHALQIETCGFCVFADRFELVEPAP